MVNTEQKENDKPMVPHVMLVVEKPVASDIIPDPWAMFLRSLKADTSWPGASLSSLEKPEQRLADNVWLLPLRDGLPILGRVAAQAKHSQLRYKLLYFEDYPDWVASDTDELAGHGRGQ